MRAPDYSRIARVWKLRLSEQAREAHRKDFGYPDAQIAGYLVNGPYHPIWSWWAGTRPAAIGAIVHEIGHLTRAALPDLDQATDTLMFEWWQGAKRWGSSEFTAPEKSALLACGDLA